MVRQLRLLLLMVILVSGQMTAQSQPEFVAEIPSASTDFTTIGDLVYFTTRDALWRSDGTPDGTFQLRNIPAGSFREFNGNLIFTSAPSSTSEELWRSDGTPEGTIRLLVAEEVTYMEEAGDYLYFAAAEPATGRELYRTNGTPGGTALVKDINPGAGDGIVDRSIYRPSISRPNSTNAYPSAGVGDLLFFAADNGVQGLEPWKTDGSSAGTVMIKDVNPGAGDGFKPCLPGSFEEEFYFTGYTVANGWEPWVSDGTNEGTHILREIIPGPEYSLGLQFKATLNGWLYFSVDKADEFGTQFELWKTDGTTANTVELKDLCSDCAFDSPILSYGNKLFFFVYVEYGTETLWETDGTSAGTRVRYSDFLDGDIPFFAIANDQVFFSTTGQGYPLNIFALDPDAGDARIVWTFKSSYTGFGRPFDIVVVDDLVFFPDHDGPVIYPGTPENPEDAYQLMQTDGYSVESVRDLHGISLDGTFDIASYNGRVLFTRVETFSDPKDLWIYDPDGSATNSTFTLVDAETDEDIRTLHDGDVISKSDTESFSIRFNPAGPAQSVMFALNGSNVRIENEAPYSLQGDINGDYTPWNKPPGSYTLKATPYSQPRAGGTAGMSLTIHFTIEEAPSECTASGTILREYWGGVQGDHVSDIPLDRAPSSTNQLTIFEGPTNIGRDYGTRIRGYICPPASGDYRFFIASNDHSELWLSSDDQPANKTLIAYIRGATNPRQWNKFTSQVSQMISLEAGKRYYIEALHKQGIGTDHIAVGWALPDGTLERPIPGSRLSPFEMEDAMMASVPSADLFSSISVYPNPATSGDMQLSVSGYDRIQESIDTDIEIINLTGDVVYAERVTCGGDCSSYLMNMNKQLVPGIYIVNMKANGQKFSKRLLVK